MTTVQQFSGAAMQNFNNTHLQHPHRKPLPGAGALQPQAHPSRTFPERQSSANSHSRSRTSSSTVLPSPSTFTSQPSPINGAFGSNRRRPSNATSSTSNSGNHATPSRTTSSVSTTIRRSTSSRSSGSPTSYVALMRKQKATVWCDRSQHEDPQTLARQKAAKLRATMEIHGGGQSTKAGSAGSASLAGRIKHHGVPRAPGYTPANLNAAGVPMRLSANEVGDGDKDDTDSLNTRLQQRTGSGRSSQGSGRYPSGYPKPQQAQGRFSSSSTPPSGDGSPGDIPELAETPVPGGSKRDDYFEQKGGNGDSSSSGEAEDHVPDMAGPSAADTREVERKKADELRRRGSVDDRTMTMSGVRLFVANPDLSD